VFGLASSRRIIPEVGSWLDAARIVELASLVVIFGLAALVTMGLAFWAHRARGDRSALVGLYLLLGAPALLLGLAGLALSVNGRGDGPVLLIVGIGLGLPLLRPVRVAFARVTPIDPASPADMIGLAFVVAATGALIYAGVQSPGPPDDVTAAGIADLVIQGLGELAIAYAAVGWWFARNLGQATARLGIRWPDWRTWLAAVGFLFAVFAAVVVLNLVTVVVQPDVLDELDPITEDLTEDVQHPAGAVVLGLSAGAGEESIFRGALQPRFGIPLTSLLFGLIHAPQYGFSLVIGSLIVTGFLLGVERKYFGTTAAIITHAAYNTIGVLLQSVG